MDRGGAPKSFLTISKVQDLHNFNMLTPSQNTDPTRFDSFSPISPFVGAPIKAFVESYVGEFEITWAVKVG